MLRDHIDGFELPDTFLARHANEVGALETLRVGLDYLAHQVGKAEQAVAATEPQDVRSFVYGNDPRLKALPRELLVCSFHWYAVSACNVVRLIGWLRHVYDPQAPEPRAYIKRVLPEVLPWRDKVAAHFARADTEDNLAERLASVVHPLAFSDGRLVAQPFAVALRRGNSRSTSGKLPPWSLTQVHEGLRARYSPQQAPVAAVL